jgi:protein-S-isoprenylcysteine O-methyltransferase Ste14
MDRMAFRILLPLVFLGYYAHRVYFAGRVRHPPGSVLRQPSEPGAPIVGLLLVVMVLASIVLYAFAPARMRWASLPLPEWSRWTGLGLACVAFALLGWSQSALGRNWSIRVQVLREHELVVTGPYRWVRHPMYTAGLLTNVSALLLSANWLVGGSWLTMHVWQFAGRIPLEEELMVQQFGDAYREYMRTTGRLLPRIRDRA